LGSTFVTAAYGSYASFLGVEHAVHLNPVDPRAFCMLVT